MPRRKKHNLKREVGVDPRFSSARVQRLIHVIMKRGKKNTARKIVYDVLDLLAKKANNDQKKALELFDKAFESVQPLVCVRPRRVGGSVYQIPTAVEPEKGESLAIRWIITAAKKRSDKTMGLRLAYELLEAVEGRGGAMRKKIEVEKMAEANRAFSHYGW